MSLRGVQHYPCGTSPRICLLVLRTRKECIPPGTWILEAVGEYASFLSLSFSARIHFYHCPSPSYLFTTIKICGSIPNMGSIAERKSMTTVTISMPESLRKFVATQVKRQGFGNVSEYFRALVREQQSKEADSQLEALLLEGLESGEDLKVTPQFWSDLKAEAAALLKKQPPKLRRKRKG